MLSIDYNFIFIHIPKTAGESITRLLKSLPPKRFSRIRTILKPRAVRPWRFPRHEKAKNIKKILGDKEWNKFFTFAFVRNPWNQMVSSYFWWLQTAVKWKVFTPHVKIIRSLKGFEEFIFSKYGMEMINEFEGNIFDWIADDDNIIVNFVGRFENLNDDWKKVCDRIGIQFSPLPLENKTKHDNYRNYYSSESKEMVAKRFRKTIEHFGYSY